MHAGVFIDRDTVVHRDGRDGGAAGFDDVRLTQGAASAIASLCGLGYRVIVVAHGEPAGGDDTSVEQRIREMVHRAANGARINAFHRFPDVPPDEHNAPDAPDARVDALREASAAHTLDPARSWVIGADVQDVRAGRKVGCRAILVRDPREPDPGPPAASNADADGDADETAPDAIAPNLIEAVRVIAAARKPEVAGEIARPALGAKRWDARAVAELQRQPPAPRHASRPAQRESESEADAHADAVEPTATEPTPRPPRASRPFRPIGAPEPAPTETHQREAPAATDTVEPAAPPAPPGRPIVLAHVPIRRRRPRATREPAASPAVAAPASVSASALGAGAQTSPESAPDSAPESDPERTLRLILKELRRQRTDQHADFSSAKMLALLLQVIAGLCLLGGLYMGAGEENFGLFLRWMGAALIFQGATISTLLFSR